MKPFPRAPDVTEEELLTMPVPEKIGLWVGLARKANRLAIPEKVGSGDTVGRMLEGFTMSPLMMFNELHGRFLAYVQTLDRGGRAALAQYCRNRSNEFLAFVTTSELKRSWTPIEKGQFIIGYNRFENLDRIKHEDEVEGEADDNEAK